MRALLVVNRQYPFTLLRAELPSRRHPVRDPAIQEKPNSHVQFDLGDVEPISVLGLELDRVLGIPIRRRRGSSGGSVRKPICISLAGTRLLFRVLQLWEQEAVSSNLATPTTLALQNDPRGQVLSAGVFSRQERGLGRLHIAIR